MLTESASELQKVVEADIAFASFNAADVGGMQPGALGQLLLRPSFRKP